jgi:hypothetical protein
MFLGSNGKIGIVSTEVKKGDFICQFFNSVICIVLRPDQDQKGHKKDTGKSGYKVVGRAAIVSDKVDEWDVSKELSGELFGEMNDKAIDIPMSLNDLTRLS